ncbi:hypothetical protein BKA70DRAFT_1301867, partial [Coprinopsis sp. MPI-PUGE-AT-0042]
MLVRVRLPATMPQLPQMPRMSIPPLPVSMSDVDLTLSGFPSSSNILLSLFAVFVLASFVRALWVGLQEHLALVQEKKQQQQHPIPAQSLMPPQEKSALPQPAEQTSNVTSSWLWGLVRWERHPVASAQSNFSNEKQSWPQYEHRRAPSMSQVGRRTGPAFARPLPTLYESDIPVSMAKMIMSRHVSDIALSMPFYRLCPTHFEMLCSAVDCYRAKCRLV